MSGPKQLKATVLCFMIISAMFSIGIVFGTPESTQQERFIDYHSSTPESSGVRDLQRRIRNSDGFRAGFCPYMQDTLTDPQSEADDFAIPNLDTSLGCQNSGTFSNGRCKGAPIDC